jgi:hypothetical protein
MQSSMEWREYTLGQGVTCALLYVQGGQLWSNILIYIYAHHSESGTRIVCIMDKLVGPYYGRCL